MTTTKTLSGKFAARWILPVSAPPIYGGWLQVEEDRIVAVESSAPPQDCHDLGNMAILPGLVNAHTHLEFSHLDNPLGCVGNSLPDWIAAVVKHRRSHATLDAEALKSERLAAIRGGCCASQDAGVRLIGEIATLPWLDQSPRLNLQVVAFAETLGLQSGRAAQTFDAATRWLAHPMAGVNFGLSPHAPYSTCPELIDCCVQYAWQRQLAVAIHFAESPQELELLNHGRGPFREILMELGAWRDGLFPRSGGLDATLQQLLNGPRVLLVHGNYLTDPQIAMLAGQPQISIVFCPRTHAYFDHPPYPLGKLIQAGVRVALGTDSLASNPDLRLWEEARHTLATIPDVSVETVLKMSTLWGAEALGCNDCGRIQYGCRPGLLTVPTTANTVAALWDSIALCRQPAPLAAR